MRDATRIKQVLKELEIYWTERPDLRLGQIVCNLTLEITKKADPFFVEDELILDKLLEKNYKHVNQS